MSGVLHIIFCFHKDIAERLFMSLLYRSRLLSSNMPHLLRNLLTIAMLDWGGTIGYNSDLCALLDISSASVSLPTGRSLALQPTYLHKGCRIKQKIRYFLSEQVV